MDLGRGSLAVNLGARRARPDSHSIRVSTPAYHSIPDLCAQIVATQYVNLYAKAYAMFGYDSGVLPLVEAACAPGLCLGASLAGVEFKLGAFVGLSLSIDAAFDAKLELRYGYSPYGR